MHVGIEEDLKRNVGDAFSVDLGRHLLSQPRSGVVERRHESLQFGEICEIRRHDMYYEPASVSTGANRVHDELLQPRVIGRSQGQTRNLCDLRAELSLPVIAATWVSHGLGRQDTANQIFAQQMGNRETVRGTPAPGSQ